MQIGRFGINEKALADISKDRFLELSKGKIEMSPNKAWALFSKEAKPYKTPKKAKETKKSSSK